MMRTVLFLGLMAVGLAACGTSATTGTDPTGWSRYDGTPVKGNVRLEEDFRYADDRCFGKDARSHRFCMASRGYTDEVAPAAAAPAITAATPAIAAATPANAVPPTDWRRRAAEARAMAARLQDPVAKQSLVGVADTYDRLADYAEGRSTTSAKSRASRQAAGATR